MVIVVAGDLLLLFFSHIQDGRSWVGGIPQAREGRRGMIKVSRFRKSGSQVDLFGEKKAP